MPTTTSQNGYSANDRSVIASYTVPGTTLRIALRKGDVSVVLLEFLRRYHLEVESLVNVPQDLWGYAERMIRGSSTTLSNHASGTAVDSRAIRHVLGARGTFTAEQLGALRKLLGWFEGVLRWGGDYSGRADEMHTEIIKGPAEVKRIADKIRAGADDRTAAPAAPAPAAAEITTSSGGPVQSFTWPAGTAAYKLICPVGRASLATKRAWLSFACDGVIESYDVWLQADEGGITEFHGRVEKDRRIWWELPDGTTQIVVHYVATGPVGAALETLPK